MTKTLSQRLADQEILLEVSEEAQTWIAENAYDPIYGARPLKRFLTKEVETPLAKEIIAGRVLPKTKVIVSLLDNHLVFENIALSDEEFSENS